MAGVDRKSLDFYLDLMAQAKRDRVWPSGSLDSEGYLVLPGSQDQDSTAGSRADLKILFCFALQETPHNLMQSCEALVPFLHRRTIAAKFLLSPPRRGINVRAGAALAPISEADAVRDFPDLCGQELCIEIPLGRRSFEKDWKDILLTCWKLLAMQGLSAELGYCQTPLGNLPINLVNERTAPFSYKVLLGPAIGAGAGAGTGAGTGSVTDRMSVALEITGEDLGTYAVNLEQQVKPNPIVHADLLRETAPLSLDALRMLLHPHGLVEKLQYLEQAFCIITHHRGRGRYVTADRHGPFFASHNVQYNDRQLADIKILKTMYLQMLKENLPRLDFSAQGLFEIIKKIIATSALLDFNRTRYRAWIKTPTDTRRDAHVCLNQVEAAVITQKKPLVSAGVGIDGLESVVSG